MASTQELSPVDFDKSNKGASKQRRDQINSEIAVMRDLLPLPESARHRLSQLQIMSLSCVYIRKCNALKNLFRFRPQEPALPDSLDFFQAMTGFLLVTTRDGKLLYISENVTDYLGHSMIDMKTQGDSLYDIVDKRDHGMVQSHLLQCGSQEEEVADSDVSFICRMNISRTLKRQPGFGDVKVMHVRGRFMNFNTTEQRCPVDGHCVFMATCSPLVTPDIKESLVQNNTTVFKTVHQLDMTILAASKNCEYHLGGSADRLVNTSWYSMIHPDHLPEAKDKHTQLIRSKYELGCMLTVRWIRFDGGTIWVNTAMYLQQPCLSQNDEPHIVCINQVIEAQEAYQIKFQGNMFPSYSNQACDPWGNQLPPFCYPAQNKNNSQWASLPVSKSATIIAEQQPNIPSHIKHSSCPNLFVAPPSSKINSNHNYDNGFNNQSNHVNLKHLKEVLKRKITEGPQADTSKPQKVARVSRDTDYFSEGSNSSFTDIGLLRGEPFNQSLISSHFDSRNQVKQVLHSHCYPAPFLISNKMSPMAPNDQHITCDASEQVVPESFSTPVLFTHLPQIHGNTLKLSPSKKTTQNKSSPNILQALKKFVDSTYVKTEEKVPFEIKETDLPVLDPHYIDTFFETITGEWSGQTHVTVKTLTKSDAKKEHEAEKTSAGNIPNFAALKDEMSTPIPLFNQENEYEAPGKTEVSPLIHIQSQYSGMPCKQIAPLQQIQLQNQTSPLQQIQIQKQTSPLQLIQKQTSPLQQMQIQKQKSPQQQIQIQKQTSPLQQILVQKPTSLIEQIQQQKQTFFQNEPQIKSSEPDYFHAISKSPDISFHSPDFYTNELQLHSESTNNNKDIFSPCKEALSPKSIASPSESVTSPETINELMNCLSDDSLDHLDAGHSTKNGLMDSEMAYLKSFNMENSNCTKILQSDTRSIMEEYSPHSSISSLEDEVNGDLLDLDLRKASNALKGQKIFPQGKDHLNSSTSDDLEFYFMFDSWLSSKDSLNMIKHSQ